MDLLGVLALLRVAGGRLLLDVQAPIREEGERPPVRREAGVRDRLARLNKGFGVFLHAIQLEREHRRIQGASTE